MAHKGNAMTETLFLVGGSVVGAGLALLFAPKSGKKCRRDLYRMGRSVSKQSDRIFNSISDGMSGFADKVGGFTGGFQSKRWGGWRHS